MERRYGLRAGGLDLERIIGRVAEIFGMRAEEIKTEGSPVTEVARRLGVTQPAVSQAVKRGARIIEERHLRLKEE